MGGIQILGSVSNIADLFHVAGLMLKDWNEFGEDEVSVADSHESFETAQEEAQRPLERTLSVKLEFLFIALSIEREEFALVEMKNAAYSWALSQRR